jgi:heat shock protein HtpX
MPITFIDIERSKSRKIAVMFLFLISMYFLIALSLLAIPAMIAGSAGSIYTTSNIFLVVFSAILIAGVHFWFSTSNAVSMVVERLGASAPDRDDGIHRQLLNITAEINVASGRKMPVRCLVIPSLSMNALAVSDLRGDAVIAITEGLLSRLTRPQVEAVVAHEAYHILSGDCLETSVAASIFGVHASAIEGLGEMSEEDFRSIPLIMVYWALMKLSLLLNMFISREREYRADAASLRMTRDPLAMAEALRVLSRNWTGTGLISSGIEMLCIISPDGTAVDESEGWWADLFSTHPPLRKRIAQLLRLARMSIPEFEKKMAAVQVTTDEAREKVYFALDRKNSWVGPLNLQEMTALPWLTPLTWVVEGKNQAAVKASDSGELRQVLSGRPLPPPLLPSNFICPSCRQALFKTSYEQTSVFECRSCGGVLVATGKLPRIIARQEQPCTERVMKLARAVITDNQRKKAAAKVAGVKPAYKSGINCSKCGNPMFRTFYSSAYLLEIDRCGVCRLTWFDRDELEMLQCLLENKVAVKIGLEPGEDYSGG